VLSLDTCHDHVRWFACGDRDCGQLVRGALCSPSSRPDCLELGSQKIPEGAKPAGMFITHLLDPVPTEIHVFTAFGSGLPLYVGVRDGRLYSVKVENGKAQVDVVQRER